MGRGSVSEERRRMLFEDAYSIWTVGSVTQEEAARLLGVSDRTMRRWVERYEDGGVDALMDKRLGRTAANAAPVDEVFDLVMNYRERHEGGSMRHYYDYYRQAGGRRSYNWVRKHLRKAGAAPRGCRRSRPWRSSTSRSSPMSSGSRSKACTNSASWAGARTSSCSARRASARRTWPSVWRSPPPSRAHPSGAAGGRRDRLSAGQPGRRRALLPVDQRPPRTGVHGAHLEQGVR